MSTPSVSAAARWCSEDPLQVGPQSVGYRITEEALVFGGDTLTTTDIAVAAGVGGHRRCRHGSRISIARSWQAAMARIQEMTEAAVDRMKTSAEPIPVIVVGGGSILIAQPIAGASEMVKPRALRGGQRGRRGHRPDLRRGRSRLLAREPLPRRRARRRQGGGERRRRSTPAPTRRRCRSSTSRTCR